MFYPASSTALPDETPSRLSSILLLLGRPTRQAPEPGEAAEQVCLEPPLCAAAGPVSLTPGLQQVIMAALLAVTCPAGNRCPCLQDAGELIFERSLRPGSPTQRALDAAVQNHRTAKRKQKQRTTV